MSRIRPVTKRRLSNVLSNVTYSPSDILLFYDAACNTVAMQSCMVVVKRQEDVAVACYGVVVCRLHRYTDENDEGPSDRTLGRWPGFELGVSRMSVGSLSLLVALFTLCMLCLRSSTKKRRR